MAQMFILGVLIGAAGVYIWNEEKELKEWGKRYTYYYELKELKKTK